jgi:hypothetical protein
MPVASRMAERNTGRVLAGANYTNVMRLLPCVSRAAR